MANAPTRFSGPVIYSGRGLENQFFENLPIGLNPDYVTFMDDFNAKQLDLDSWDDETLNSGTVGLLGSGDDYPWGWAIATGSGTTAESGAGLQLNETIQGQRETTNWLEAKVALEDADKSDLFVGLCTTGTLGPTIPFGAGQRIGIQVEDGSSEIKCITRDFDTTETTSTGIHFTDYVIPSTEESEVVEGSRILGFRWTNPTGPGATPHVYRVDFFVDRVLVATHMNTADSQSISTNVFSPWWAFLQGSGVASAKSSVLDYMFVVSSRGKPGNGKMITFGASR